MALSPKAFEHPQRREVVDFCIDVQFALIELSDRAPDKIPVLLPLARETNRVLGADLNAIFDAEESPAKAGATSEP